MTSTPLTIYCCGTNYDWTNDGELIADTFENTESQAWIVAGPGSGKRSTGILDRLIGLAGGEDHMDGAVDAVVQKLQALDARPTVVNLAGWSRGAITCHAIAFKLRRTAALAGIKLHVFAIDPVPGPTNFEQRFLQIDENVRDYTAVYMQNELRRIMTPGEPRFTSSRTHYRYLNFPGRHSDGVERAKGFEEVAEVVRHLAEQFLTVRGSRLKEQHLLPRVQLIDRYSTMILKTRQYFENANLVAGSKWAARSIKGLGVKNTLENHLSQGDGYFINMHHRHEFSQAYPAVHAYYFTNAVIRRSAAERQRNFQFQTPGARERVLAELKQMAGASQKTYATLGIYQWIMSDLEGDAASTKVRSFGREATCVDPIRMLSQVQ